MCVCVCVCVREFVRGCVCVFVCNVVCVSNLCVTVSKIWAAKFFPYLCNVKLSLLYSWLSIIIKFCSLCYIVFALAKSVTSRHPQLYSWNVHASVISNKCGHMLLAACPDLTSTMSTAIVLDLNGFSSATIAPTIYQFCFMICFVLETFLYLACAFHVVSVVGRNVD